MSKNSAAGTQSWLYLDGRRVTVGKDFVTRSRPGHLTTIARTNGLRDGVLPNGAPAFRESFGTMRDAYGQTQRTIVRTVYARVHNGKAWTLTHPVTQTYRVVPYRGSELYVYQPWTASPSFYDPFFVPFAVALMPRVGCPECMYSDEFSFQDPPDSYDDPSDLIGDKMIADGFHRGINDSPDDVGPPDAPEDPNVPPVAIGNAEPDPELVGLANDASQLERQVDDARDQDTDLHDQLSDQGVIAGAAESDAGDRQSSGDRRPHKPVKISSSVRDQMRQQTKQAMELEKNQQPLSLADLISSDNARTYLFQVSDIITTTDVDSGDECVLSTGDLIMFHKLPEGDANAAQMRVVTGKDGSCRAGSVVPVSLADLQRMLNGYSQQLELVMHDVHDKIEATQKPDTPTKG